MSEAVPSIMAQSWPWGIQIAVKEKEEWYRIVERKNLRLPLCNVLQLRLPKWFTYYYTYLMKKVELFRWGTHLYMSLFPSVCSSCLSVHPSVAHHISGTVYHLIIFLEHSCRMMISPGVFFIFSKFWFFVLLGRGGER